MMARLRIDIALLFRGLLYAYVIVGGLMLGRQIALLLLAAWLPAALSIAGYVAAAWYIVRDLRRAYRRELYRQALSEACAPRGRAS